jgi:hypothetical protein
MTSENDVQGDTPGPGDWGELRFSDGTIDSNTVLEHVKVRYGQGIVLESASPTFSHATIEFMSGPAIRMDLKSFPKGIGNSAKNNGKNAILVASGDMLVSGSWELQGIPFLIEGTLSVGQSPEVQSITPSELEQGSTILATIVGKRLSNAESISFSGTGLAGAIQPGGTDTQVTIRITAQPNAPVGNQSFEIQVAAGKVSSPVEISVASPGTLPVSVSIEPATATVVAGTSKQFNAIGVGTTNENVTWSLESIGPVVGTISSTGLYSVPSTFTDTALVIIRATSNLDISKSATAQAYVFPSAPQGPVVAPQVSVGIAPLPSAAGPSGPFVAPQVSVGIAPLPSAAGPSGPFVAPQVSVAIAQSPLAAGPSGPFVAPQVSVALTPTISSISPNSGAQGTANLSITITGKGLAGATAISFLLNGAIDNTITATNVTANVDGTQVTAEFSITSTAPIGFRIVRISTPNGTSPSIVLGGNTFSVTASTTGQCTSPPPNLVSWWPADGNSNDIIDSNNGSFQNGATFAGGNVGQAFSFDGVNDYVSVSDSSSLKPSGPFSLELWLKQNTNSICDGSRNNFVPMGKVTISTSGYMIYEECTVNNWNFIVYGVSPQNVSFNSPNEPGVWKHFVGVYDGTRLLTYVNGSLTNQVSVTGTVLHSNDNLQFGKYSTSNNFFDGFVDEATIYNRALTASEIQAIFNAGSAGKCKTTP